MKKFFYLSMLVLALASCKKNAYDFSPTDTKPTDTTATTITQPGAVTGNPIQVPDKNQITGFYQNMPDQNLKISIKGKEVDIVFNEDVVLLARTANLNQSYAVHFKEDFSASVLKNYDFYSVTREGANAYNWVDDNLNNINKTKKDTVINNIAITKIEVTRTFNFMHIFDSEDAALAEYNRLVADKSQTISFSAYYAPVDPNTITVIGKATLIFEGTK